MIKVQSAFIDNNPNFSMLIHTHNKATLHSDTLPLTKKSENKVCIPKDITIGTSEEITNGCYSINEITLTGKPNDIKTDVKPV